MCLMYFKTEVLQINRYPAATILGSTGLVRHAEVSWRQCPRGRSLSCPRITSGSEQNTAFQSPILPEEKPF